MTGQPQNLVCLTTSGSLGGAETSLLTLLAALRQMEPAWRISAVAPSEGPLAQRCRSFGIEVDVLPYPDALAELGESGLVAGRGAGRFVARGLRASADVPRYLRSLRAAVRDRHATVVHSNGLKAHIAAALALPSSVRVVWQLHDYVRARPVSAALLRLLAHRVHAIVANSHSVLQDAAGALGPSAPIRRIYNAVDLASFNPTGSALDLAELACLPPSHGDVRVGLVATLARWKGHSVFIDAIAKVRRRKQVRAYIIGGPVYQTAGSQLTMAELHAQVASSGLTGVVGLTGAVENVPAALRALDIVVHASTRPEPFGMVIAEAMASGRPVVAARAGGAAELFDDGVNAVGYVPGDGVDLAAKLEDLIARSDARTRLGTAARAAACERFAPQRMAAEFREVYVA